MNRPPTLHYDPDRDPQRRRRLEDAYRRLGTRNPECARSDCDETDPFSLTGAYPEILCYEHQASADGRSTVEADHRFGQANDPMTLDVPGNDHRVLSDLQSDWDPALLRNPHRSPLIRAAATIQGFLDFLWLLISRVLGWLPTALKALDEILTVEHGTEWWDKLGWVAA